MRERRRNNEGQQRRINEGKKRNNDGLLRPFTLCLYGYFCFLKLISKLKSLAKLANFTKMKRTVKGNCCAVKKKIYNCIKVTDRSPRLVMRQKIAPGHFLPSIAVHWQLFTPSVFHQNFHFLLLLSLGNSLLLPTSSLNLLPDLGHNNIGIWHYNALGRMFLTALTELSYTMAITWLSLSSC